ncbi:hypothetical protein Syun_013229 [Stephania yunnanensis]|uniref:Uncharacterized protein n=1 Tax=Stephania yunnanensis TaxID=152371 RepID=A0AAP0PID7_9MAGN
MRGTTELLYAKSFLRQIRPTKGAIGSMLKSVCSKRGNNDVKGEGVPNTDNKVEPIAVFSKPPLPPVLGPVAALSLLELGSNYDRNEDSDGTLQCQ